MSESTSNLRLDNILMAVKRARDSVVSVLTFLEANSRLTTKPSTFSSQSFVSNKREAHEGCMSYSISGT